MAVSSPPRTLAWIRDDVRVDDHVALRIAVERGRGGCGAIFVISHELWDRCHWGPRRRAMVLGGVEAMRAALAERGIPLFVARSSGDAPPDRVVADVASALKVDEVHAIREFGCWEARRDESAAELLEADGRRLFRHEGQTILSVREIRSGSGTPYSVFTPFKKRWLAIMAAEGRPDPEPTPSTSAGLDASSSIPHASTLDASIPKGTRLDFIPGEDEPARRLEAFLDGPIERYHDDRDPPALDGTSSLSPWLACGSISPRRILHHLAERFGDSPSTWDEGATTWLSELVWREFYRHVMDGFPRLTMDRPLHGWTDRVAWRDSDADFEAWCEGRTGIAIVDAGMRQLAATGWMHNRVRMITATFLAKHLLLDWRRGERFFMQSLADADFPSNNGGWQWAASTGTDAAPYFRVFNPDTQRERFDPRSEYVRRWAPDHAGGTAPRPLVELKPARMRAIEAFKVAKNG